MLRGVLGICRHLRSQASLRRWGHLGGRERGRPRDVGRALECH